MSNGDYKLLNDDNKRHTIVTTKEVRKLEEKGITNARQQIVALMKELSCTFSTALTHLSLENESLVEEHSSS